MFCLTVMFHGAGVVELGRTIRTRHVCGTSGWQRRVGDGRRRRGGGYSNWTKIFRNTSRSTYPFLAHSDAPAADATLTLLW
jgi:hypothetical protein